MQNHTLTEAQLLSGWGRFPVVYSELVSPYSVAEAITWFSKTKTISCRGNGRGYGDCALNAQSIMSSLGLNYFHSFDASTGLLVAGAGVTLAQVLSIMVPRGFFLSVTPGTKYASLGGAVAADVHGKDHHLAGTFSNSVEYIELITATDGLVRCSRTERSDLFFATLGGMGLTGFIVTVALCLKPIPSAYVQQTTITCGCLREIMDCFLEHQDVTYSVSWIDCLQQSEKKRGRSLFMAGEFAADEVLPVMHRRIQHQGQVFYNEPHHLKVPFDFPSRALNPYSVRAFNSVYFHKTLGRHCVKNVVPIDPFFYPLDAILDWNRIYGHNGFTQYQFVLPLESSLEGITAILKAIANSGKGSFLTVLKLFGAHNNHQREPLTIVSHSPTAQAEERSRGGYLSFPQQGFTLALDFAIEPSLFALLSTLDDMVRDYGGRIYLAKDSRMSAANFRAMYSRNGSDDCLDRFLQVKAHYDPHNLFSSLQAQRLGLMV